MDYVLLLLFTVDLAGTVLGIYAMRSRPLSGKFTIISAGVMVGVALFWIFPDMTRQSGIMHAALAAGVALAALYAIDRFVYPVCPCCGHGGRGGASAGALRRHVSAASGTLIPLVIAICVHNLFDGWTAAMAQYNGSRSHSGIAVGLIAHKLPEALVFGLMLRCATNRPLVPLLSVSLTSLAILAGAAAHSGIRMLSETTVITTSLALACGSFLFTGAHIFFRQQRQAGTRSAVAPLILGLLASAAVEETISAVLAQSR
jgi:zinc transporter ZupT